MAIGWGITGIGHFADTALAPAINRAAGARLAAVCSRSMERARAFAGKHGAASAYDSYAGMLADPAVDAVLIATPNHLHAAETVQAARAGRHVLCEKPMAMSVAECERMIEACARAGVKLGVGYPNRLHPAHQEARRLVRGGMLGEVQYATANLCRGISRGFWKGWRADPAQAGSGALAGQAVHPIDILRFLMDTEVTEVRAITDEKPPERPVDDMVYAMLGFANGATATVVSGLLVPRIHNGIVLYGEKAKLQCDATQAPGSAPDAVLSVEGGAELVRHAWPNADPIVARSTRVIEAFGRSVAENAPLELSAENGLAMLRIERAVQQSSREGRVIRL